MKKNANKILSAVQLKRLVLKHGSVVLHVDKRYPDMTSLNRRRKLSKDGRCVWTAVGGGYSLKNAPSSCWWLSCQNLDRSIQAMFEYDQCRFLRIISVLVKGRKVWSEK